MTGQQPLIAMRQKGKRPALVSFWDAPGFDWTERPESWAYPDVVIAPEDTPERLDLRFVVGLAVQINVEDESRMKRLVLACESAGAAKVFGFVTRSNKDQTVSVLAAICTHGEDQSWRH